MANPLMGAIGIGSSIFGSLMGASGAQQSAGAQAGQYMYQAGLAQLNAQIAEQNAIYALKQGESQAFQYGQKSRQEAGQIRAGQGASGLDVSTGSSKDVQISQHTVSMIDMNTIRTNAAKVAYDYRTQAEEYRSQAMMDLFGAQNVRQAGNTNAMASLIGGASSVAEKWLRGKEMGMWNFGE